MSYIECNLCYKKKVTGVSVKTFKRIQENKKNSSKYVSGGPFNNQHFTAAKS